jgi:hypothetical protein
MLGEMLSSVSPVRFGKVPQEAPCTERQLLTSRFVLRLHLTLLETNALSWPRRPSKGSLFLW